MDQRLTVTELMFRQVKKKKRKAEKERDLVIQHLNVHNIDFDIQNVDSDSSEDDEDDDIQKQSEQILQEILSQKKKSVPGDGSKEMKYEMLLDALKHKCDRYLELQIEYQSVKDEFE